MAQEQYFERLIFYDNLKWILFGIATLIFIIRVIVIIWEWISEKQ